jgi:hypothetical protein
MYIDHGAAARPRGLHSSHSGVVTRRKAAVCCARTRWSVGLAHATSPEGPWKKASAVNPIINESIVGFDGF